MEDEDEKVVGGGGRGKKRTHRKSAFEDDFVNVGAKNVKRMRYEGNKHKKMMSMNGKGKKNKH